MNTLLRFFLATSVSLAASANAGAVPFTVDSSLSLVTVSGTFQGVELAEQLPGSATAHYMGFFNTEWIAGQLAITANQTQALWQDDPLLPIPPEDNGGRGAYGFRANTPALGELKLAITGVSLYLNTGYRPPLDVADGSFAAQDIGFFMHGDTVMLAAPGWAGNVDLHGRGAPNQSALPGTFTSDGLVETLTIPILTTISESVLAPDDLTLKFSGQIVATRPVPEPGSASLLAAGAMLALRRTRRW